MSAIKDPSSHEQEAIFEMFLDIQRACVNCQSEEDQELILEAFNFAYNAHYGVARKTGEQYITHPLEVARIVGVELRLDVVAVVCALIHDVVEDTIVSIEEVRARFGNTVAVITDGLTKVEKMYNMSANSQAENFKKLLLTINVDIRVVFIKLADRMHNMRTLHGMRENKQLEKSGEVLYLFAPLAHRLGMHNMKRELEDLSFRFRRPQEYETIKEKSNEVALRLRKVTDKLIPQIKLSLKDLGLDFRIEIIQRSCYSVWKQLQSKSITMDEIPFLISMQIIFTPKEKISETIQCWEIYGTLSAYFPVSESMFRNYLDKPRSNSYQAIHGGIKIDNKKVAFQVMSERMYDIASRGYAVEPLYKKSYQGKTNIEKWLNSVREALEDPDKNATEFVDDFITNLYSSDIYVFTPKGQIRTLPKGATVLDFAYEIHSDLGNKCIGAKVNNIIRQPNYVLQGGEEIVILDIESQKPKIEWLDFVVSPKAIAALKKIFRTEGETEIEQGKSILDSIFKELKIRSLEEAYDRIKEYIPYHFSDELHYKLGIHKIKEEDIKILFQQSVSTKDLELIKPVIDFYNNPSVLSGAHVEKIKIDTKNVINLSDSFDVTNFKYAPCCNPLPGDDVVGSVNFNDEIVIHRTDCPTSIRLSASSSIPIVKIIWHTHKVATFLTRIKITGLDRPKLLKDIVTVISDNFDINIKAVHTNSEDGYFEGFIDLYVHCIDDLNKVREGIKVVKSVDEIKRVLLAKAE